MGKQGDRCIEAFGDLLKKVGNPDLRQYVVDVFDKLCPEYFWLRAASSSHKYHPKVMNQEPGGLVLHTRYVFWWADQFGRSMDSDGRTKGPDGDLLAAHRDVILCSTILHDMMKDGDITLDAERGIKRGADGNPDMKDPTTKSRYYDIISGGHGVDCANAICRDFFGWETSKMTRDQVLINYGIASHMGVWTTPASYRPENLQDPEARLVARIVHTSDYAASRKADEYFAGLTNK